MPPSSSLGWTCGRCTFRHHAPGNRCVMCNELRVSKEQMRDFILGNKQNPAAAKDNSKNQSEDDSSLRAPSPPSMMAAARTETPKLPLQSASERAPPNKATTGTTVRNPYARKNGGAPQAVSAGPQLLRPPPPAPSVLSQKCSLHRATAPAMAQSPPSQQQQQQQQQQRTLASNSGLTEGNHNSSKHRTTTAHKSKNPFTIAAQAAQQSKRNTQHPRPLAQGPPYQPGPVPLALHLADTWIYPSADAYPKRQYQFEISEKAVLQNTLVSLPTGLGKTLIAAVVLYNYYRWFPTGKVLFLAPTLPLVDQQVQACYEIMGIPASDTALLTGKVAAPQRTSIWQQKRVFFCTPQTVQKDLENDRCPASEVVCVVLDEAHKATGEYSYCKVVEYLEGAGAKFRLLGLSATPGTTIRSIQDVVNVLRINCIEARSDADPDVKQYIHERQTEVVIVKQVAASKVVERRLDEIIGPILDRLRSMGVLRQTGYATVTSFCLIKARDEFYKRRTQVDSGNNAAIGFFAAGIVFIQLRSDLHKHGIGIVRSKLHKMRTERQIGHTSTIVKSKAFQLLWEEVCRSSCDPDAVGNTVDDRLRNNPKLSKLREILTEHFERARACGEVSTRAIVFSQFRDSVSEIVDVLNTSRPLILARQFVGQGKSSSKQSSGGCGDGGAAAAACVVRGMKQEEQKKVIQEFRDNVHNTLVCTCIGEEGLDIGEVDIISEYCFVPRASST